MLVLFQNAISTLARLMLLQLKWTLMASRWLSQAWTSSCPGGPCASSLRRRTCSTGKPALGPTWARWWRSWRSRGTCRKRWAVRDTQTMNQRFNVVTEDERWTEDKNLHVSSSVWPLFQSSERIRPIGQVQIWPRWDGVLAIGRRSAVLAPGQWVVLIVVIPEKTRGKVGLY